MKNLPTDYELLNWLQEQNDKKLYTGRCIFRWSITERGWRLHETSMEDGCVSVREAIAKAMKVN